jgi:hypothetical protein
MKTFVCVGETLHGGEWPVALTNRFTPEKIDPCTGGWVGLRVGLTIAVKILVPVFRYFLFMKPGYRY